MSAARFRRVAIVGCVLPRVNDVESSWAQVTTGGLGAGRAGRAGGPMKTPRFRPVAIVGCVLPRANDVESFGTQVSTGVSALGVLDAREAP